MKVKDSLFPFLFSGKFGNFYGRVVNGKQIISIKRAPRRSKATTSELAARRKFLVASQFVRPMLPVVQKYNEKDGRSGFHKAMSHILRNAIQGEHPDQRMDFSKVVFGEGILPNPKIYSVSSSAKGLLEFNWSLERVKRHVSKTDRIFTVAWCEANHQYHYELCGAERRERKFLMNVSQFSGARMEVYFGFASSNGLLISTSVYAGSIKVL